jgi:hypothetical protein
VPIGPVAVGQTRPAAPDRPGYRPHRVVLADHAAADHVLHLDELDRLTLQLSNEPSAPPGQGRFTRLTPTALEMFFRYYAPRKMPDDRIVHGGRAPATD